MDNLIQKIQITPGTVADIRDFNEIQKICWLQVYPNETAGITKEDILARDWDSPKRWRMWRKSVSGGWLKRTRYWAARTQEGKVVGFCVAIKEWSYGEIDKIYVLPEYQGKGVGRKLLEPALEWLTPYDEVRIGVVTYNTRAIRFYEKFGFRDSAKKDHETVLPSGKRLLRIMMVLRRQ
jgi:ribosomal protein S18 acetylase RimI-like enzyme